MRVKCGKFAIPKDMETAMQMAAKACRRNGYDTCFAMFRNGEVQELHLFGYEGSEVTEDVIAVPADDGWDRYKHVDGEEAS